MFLYNERDETEGGKNYEKLHFDCHCSFRHITDYCMFCGNKWNNGDKNTNQSKISVKETAVEPLKILNGPNITLIAKEEKQEIGNGVVVPVWTFNGSAPGPEIRVKKGEKVKITLKNNPLCY